MNSLIKCASACLGVAGVLALMAGTALADGGGGARSESDLNKDGFESESQASEGYSNLNDAAFVLLFDKETRVTGSLFNRREVTPLDASNRKLFKWAYDLTMQAYADRRAKREAMEETAKIAMAALFQWSSPNDAADPVVRLQATPKNSAENNDLKTLSEKSAASLRALRFYRPNIQASGV